MNSIKELQDKIIKRIDDMLENADVKSFELQDAMNNAAKEHPDYKEDAEKISNYWRTIRDMNDSEQIWNFCGTVGKIILIVQKDKNKKELDKSTKDLEWWRKYSKGEHDWQKKTLTPEEKQKRSEDLDKQPKPKDDFDEKSKQKYIADIEFELKAKKITETKLNQRLGVSDWREEISKTASWSQALDRRSDINMIIWELSNDFVCAKCGEEANSSLPWTKGNKKYCSYECRYKKDSGKIDATDVSKIVEAFQGWMKKNHIEKISYNVKGELIIQFENQTAKAVEDSQLSKEQKEIKQFFKANPQTSEISAKERYEYNPNERRKGGISNMNRREATFYGLVIVGIVAIIIALIVWATSRNKD